MIIYSVEVHVVKGMEKDFISASLENRKETVKEPGNIRFDILRMEEDRSVFMLFEVYESEDAVKAHKQTDHYLVWREKVSPMMKVPRKGVKYIPVSDF